MNERIVLVGAGNMATVMAYALKESGNAPVAVWSRTVESAALLGGRVGCAFTNDIASLPAADVVIISVPDNTLHDVAAAAAQCFPDALLLHTAGSIPMDALREAGATRYGVLYPMQTVNKNSPVSLKGVTTFIEGCDDAVTEIVEKIACLISDKVVYASSEQRSSLHVAAVFACNFVNAMYSMSAEILGNQGLPFEIMHTLIDETAAKIHTLSPAEAQTGPARRRDETIIERQRAMLTGEYKEIYDLVTRYIISKADEIRNTK